MEEFFVYILYNKDFDKFYIGQTNDLERRLFEHNSKKTKYTSKYYGEWRIVYQEVFKNRTEAIIREKFLKQQKNKSFYRSISNTSY